MKKLTVEQLQALTWTCIAHEIDESNCDQDTVVVGIDHDAEGNEVDVTREYFSRYSFGTVAMQSNEDPEIKINFCWQATNQGKHSYTDSFDFELDFCSEGDSRVEGASIVDDDGDEVTLSVWEISEIVKGCEWENMVRADLPTPEVEEIEMGEGEEFTLERDNAPSLKFKGECIGVASSKDPYNNNNGRWVNLCLYKTEGGKFICYQENITCWQGERNKYKAEVCNTEAEVIAWFGQGRVAKELYEDASIENVESID